jgi:ankyrin repeat protein
MTRKRNNHKKNNTKKKQSEEDVAIGYDAILLAISNRQSVNHIIELIKLYPMAIQYKDRDNNYLLHHACSSNCTSKIILKLIELYPLAVKERSNKRWHCPYYPLHLALMLLHDECVIIKLLEIYPDAVAYKDYTSQGFSALDFASSESKYYDVIVPKLIEINPLGLQERKGSWGKYPFHEICSNEDDNDTIVEYFIQRPDVNVNIRWPYYEETPLHLACQYGNHKIVKKLLQQPNIDVNAINWLNNTPIHSIFHGQNRIKDGHVRVIRNLLDHPFFDLNVRNGGNKTPMDLIDHILPNAIIYFIDDNEKSRYLDIQQLLKEYMIKRKRMTYDYLINNFV